MAVFSKRPYQMIYLAMLMLDLFVPVVTASVCLFLPGWWRRRGDTAASWAACLISVSQLF